MCWQSLVYLWKVHSDMHRTSLALCRADGVVSAVPRTLSHIEMQRDTARGSIKCDAHLGAKTTSRSRGCKDFTSGSLAHNAKALAGCYVLSAGGWRLEGQLGDVALPLQGGQSAAVQQAVATTGKS